MTGLLLIELRVRHEWENVERVRHIVHQALLTGWGSIDLADALSMVACELLENALHYGDGSGALLRVAHDGGTLTLAVTNSVPEASPHTDELRRRIDELNKFTDPTAAFRAALERRPREGSINGLGLARMIFEGECVLDCDLSRPGEVTVRAIRTGIRP